MCYMILNGLHAVKLVTYFQVRRYFDKADKNKDGKLTKDEWHSVLNGSGVSTSKYV